LLCGVIGIVALANERARLVAITAALAVVLPLLSYRAAVASARGYGLILETIAKITRPAP
jgi:hypothetical protein